MGAATAGVAGVVLLDADVAAGAVGIISFWPTTMRLASLTLFTFIRSSTFTPYFLAIRAGDSPKST